MGNGSYARIKTRIVPLGDIPMGGNYPVRVQSMTNTDTMDVKATVDQAERMIRAGCEYVRIAVPGMMELQSLRKIKDALHRKGMMNPLIADVHFKPKIAEEAARIVEKVRINPGNYLDKRETSNSGKPAWNETENSGILERIATRIDPLLKICKEYGTAIRIGVNHGSLSGRILTRFGNTPEGMVESALEFARICRDRGFGNLVLSLKATNTWFMIRANRLLVQKMQEEQMDYPLHLGVTEAGSGEDGRLKSAIGIGSLLTEGIGDTIRVSITEDPECEIPVAYGILQASGTRITRTEFISCPTCARTQYNIQEITRQARMQLEHLSGLKIAIMGCIVNGPGEMADADYGYVGSGQGKVTLYRRQIPVQKDLDEIIALESLIRLIKENGDWVDP